MSLTVFHLVFTLLPKTEALGLGKKAGWGFRRQSQPRMPLWASAASSEKGGDDASGSKGAWRRHTRSVMIFTS